MEKIFYNVNSKFISELIKDSKNRIIYASPGINQSIMGSIFKVKDRIGIENIVLIIDADSNVLRYGYGDEESVSYMNNSDIPIKTQKGLRIGLICVDLDGYIFTPTPLSIEDEKLDKDNPNAIHITGKELERILNSIIPKTPLENENVQIGKNKIKNEEAVKIKKEIESKPLIRPDLQRQMNVINSKFQIVDIDFKGSKLQNKTFKIDAKELGITNKEIGEKISTTYKIFKSLSLPFEFDNLDIKLNKIKTECLEKIENVGLLLLHEKYKKFDTEIDKFKQNIVDVQGKCIEKIDLILNKSKSELAEFVATNLMKLSSKEKDKLVPYENPNKENLKLYVENKLRRNFPNA